MMVPLPTWVCLIAVMNGHTYGGVVRHSDDLHGHLLGLATVVPLAHAGANDMERLLQGAGGSVGTAQLGQLSHLRHQRVLRQQLGRARQCAALDFGYHNKDRL